MNALLTMVAVIPPTDRVQTRLEVFIVTVQLDILEMVLSAHVSYNYVNVFSVGLDNNKVGHLTRYTFESDTSHICRLLTYSSGT